MEVTLKRGSVAVQTTSVKAEDANTLILTTASKIQDATYTVTVTEKETTFTGEAEKLTTLAITGENAVVDNADIRKATSATVPYEAKNQFGEDMNVSLTASSSLSPTVSAKNGIITITINATSGSSVSLIEGQIVSVSIVSATDGKSAAATVTLSSSSKIKTLTVEGIYNKDDLSFNEDNKDKGAFYLILDAEDQYGYKVTDPKTAKGSLMGVCTNSLVAEMAMTSGNEDLVFESLTINGVKKLGVQIKPKLAGTTNVILTPKYYGGSVQYEATVLSGTKVDTLTFIQPDGAYLGEEVLIPVEAVDANGNSITDPKALNEWVSDDAGKLNITMTGGSKYTKPFEKTSSGVLVYNAGKAIGSVITVNATTPTYKFASIVVYVTKAPTPDRIEGISSTKVLNLISGGAVTLDVIDFELYDTDDRRIYSLPEGYKIKAITDTSISGTGLNVIGTQVADKTTLTVSASGSAVNWGNDSIKSTSIAFQIFDDESKTVGDAYTATFKHVKLDKLTRAEITAPDQVYAATSVSAITHTIGKGLQVVAYCGTDKVIVPGELWDIKNMDAVSGAFITIATQAGIGGASIGAIGGDGITAASWTSISGTTGSKTNSVNVAIAISGSSIAATKAVTACQAAPVLTTVTTKPFVAGITSTGENQFSIKLGKGAGTTITGGAIISNYLSVKDQYGVDYAAHYGEADFVKIFGNPVVLITDINGVEVEKNGTASPEIKMLDAGDSFTVTITWGTKTIIVNVEQR